MLVPLLPVQLTPANPPNTIQYLLEYLSGCYDTWVPARIPEYLPEYLSGCYNTWVPARLSEYLLEYQSSCKILEHCGGLGL